MKPVQLVKPDGTVVKGATLPDVPDADLRKMFETILINREIDERMLTVQRQGRIGFYMQSRGEEASILGAVYPTTKNDWMFLCYRELASLLQQGFAIDDDLALTAEVGGQGLLHQAVESAGLGDVLGRPAQDVAGAVRGLRPGAAVVGDAELHDEVAARREPECAQVEAMCVATACCAALAAQRQVALLETDAFAFALRQGDA